MEYQQQSYRHKKPNMGGMTVLGIPFLTGFFIINSGIPTPHQINITAIVGIPYTIR